MSAAAVCHLSLALVVLVVALLRVPAAAYTATVVSDAFVAPIGLVYNPVDTLLYVADARGAYNASVNAMTTAGVLVGPPLTFTHPMLTYPTELAVDSFGELYVADEYFGTNQMFKFSTNGTRLQTFAVNGTEYDSIGVDPYGVFVDANSDVWVAEAGTGRLVQFAANGTVLQIISGATPPVFTPSAVVVDSAGDAYISDISGRSGTDHRILKRTAAGVFSVLYTGLGLPQGLVLDGRGMLYVSDSGNSRIVQLTTDGVFVQNITTAGGQLSGPPFSGMSQLTFDPAGALYATDSANHRVLKFTGLRILDGGSSSGGVSSSPSTGSSSSTGLSSVRGDPSFVGLRGQSYQVHGIDNTVYNLISSPATQVNSRFVFLTRGACPMLDGVVQHDCWSHPGSYMGAVAVQAVVAGVRHTALLTAGGAARGFHAVQVDGVQLAVGEQAAHGPAFSVSYRSSHSVRVQLEHFDLQLSNSDRFINLALAATVELGQLNHTHGLIGQTHSAKLYKTALRWVEGDVDDYAIEDNELFGSGFVYNRFQL